MSSSPHFFALIIGSEILNRRREDKHFDFLTKTLATHGHKLTGSFIIEDDPALIINTLKFIASHPNAVLFSFGGIGSTPDDHTRKCAAMALRNGQIETNQEAQAIIEQTLGNEAYPHPIKMAELPVRAKLLHNPVNEMPAFYLDDRYFFMPGFPEMSHPMVDHILEDIIPDGQKEYRYTLTAQCKENLFIPLMQNLPLSIEVSSLPTLKYKNTWHTTLSLTSRSHQEVQKVYKKFINLLEKKGISYIKGDPQST